MKQVKDVALEPTVSRLLEFVKQKGGPSEVARDLGMDQPSVFNQYKTGRNRHPSTEILQRLSERYADFDPLYVLTGRRTAQVQHATDMAPVPSDDVRDAQLEGLRRENALQRDTINILRAVVSAQLGKDLGGKSESGASLTPSEVSARLRKVGLRRVISLSMRDARGISQIYPNPAPMFPMR